MAKKKTSVSVIPYVPKQDKDIYIYIRKNAFKLNPVPYKYKPNYKYLIDLINSK